MGCAFNAGASDHRLEPALIVSAYSPCYDGQYPEHGQRSHVLLQTAAPSRVVNPLSSLCRNSSYLTWLSRCTRQAISASMNSCVENATSQAGPDENRKAILREPMKYSRSLAFSQTVDYSFPFQITLANIRFSSLAGISRTKISTEDPRDPGMEWRSTSAETEGDVITLDFGEKGK